MKTKQKGIYQPPTSTVVEMNTQGVLCWSNTEQSIVLGILSIPSPTDGVQDYQQVQTPDWD